MRAGKLLVKADLIRLIRGPKFWLIILFMLFFVYDFVSQVKPYAVNSGLGITPYLYPVYLADWSGRLYSLLLIIVAMSDAPFYTGSEMFIKLRVNKYIWGLCKNLYIFAISFIFQVITIVFTIVMCLPYLGISNDWGDVIRTFLTDRQGAISVSGILEEGIEVLYHPYTAMIYELLIMTLISLMLGLMIFILNGLFKSYAGTVVIGILSCLHTYISDFDFYGVLKNVYNKIPMSWIDLSGYTEGMSPIKACIIISVILLVLTVIQMILIKCGKITIEGE